jgi:NADH-quinone oxidoreductase subunit L
MMMNEYALIAFIALPVLAGLVLIPWRAKGGLLSSLPAIAAAIANFSLAVVMFQSNLVLSIPWTGFGLDFVLRLYHTSGFIILAISGFTLLVILYSSVFMKGKPSSTRFYGFLLLTAGMANGAVLSDNLILMLFFWEGLLVTLYCLIAIGGSTGHRTALKAFVIVASGDLCLMLGIALVAHLSGSYLISEIKLTTDTGLAQAAFLLLMIGAVSKAGAMPFHSWIPDAAASAHLPFMAFLPAALEKLMGIYFLARVSLDIFTLKPDTYLSYIMMTVGCVTILFAVLMALIQKDYKRLLSFHAISQVGYMVLGIGTTMPIGIIGGLFHMLNHAIYKSCLFLSGGSVELQTGTTDLNSIGGLARKMPVTFACFFIAAMSISGVPPMNGFFSKEFVYDAALERGAGFYLMAVLGSFFTAASFLKLGHAAYFGPLGERHRTVREAPIPMLVPMIVLASLCVFLGVANYIPLEHLIKPVLKISGVEMPAEGMHINPLLLVMTGVVLVGALLNHIAGAKLTGSGIGAVDHIHDMPVLSTVFKHAERRAFDPYNWGKGLIFGLSKFLYKIDRGIDALIEGGSSLSAGVLAGGLQKLQSGNYATYVALSIIGAVMIIAYILR